MPLPQLVCGFAASPFVSPTSSDGVWIRSSSPEVNSTGNDSVWIRSSSPEVSSTGNDSDDDTEGSGKTQRRLPQPQPQPSLSLADVLDLLRQSLDYFIIAMVFGPWIGWLKLTSWSKGSIELLSWYPLDSSFLMTSTVLLDLTSQDFDAFEDSLLEYQNFSSGSQKCFFSPCITFLEKYCRF